MVERFQILSLDGGGIKGLFAAAVLAKVEEDLQIRLADHFDLIAGTSTGGIIALGLGSGMSPEEIVDFYINDGPKIFGKTPFSGIKHLFARKYRASRLETALKSRFGNKQLGHSKKRLVIPSYNLDSEQVYICKTSHNERLRRDYKSYMWQVAMATSAAPTYFPSFKGIDGLRLIDGGIWANNPSVVAVIEACSMLNVPLDSIRLLSVGTTYDTTDHPFYLNFGGQLLWARSIAGIIMRAQSEGITGQVEHLLGDDRYLRINPGVAKGLFKLDRLNLETLMARAAEVSRDYSPHVQNLICDYTAPQFVPHWKLEE